MTDTVPPGDHAVEVEERQEDKDDMDDMDDMDDSAGDSSGWFFRVPSSVLISSNSTDGLETDLVVSSGDVDAFNRFW